MHYSTNLVESPRGFDSEVRYLCFLLWEGAWEGGTGSRADSKCNLSRQQT